MKLSKISILALKGLALSDKERVSSELGMTLQTFYKNIRVNESNGTLTKAIAIEIIKRETGLGYEQILEGSAVSES